MNVLKFKKGYSGYETGYEVELDFEYTADLEKRITSIILYRPDIGKKVVIPWQIFKLYLRGETETAFADSSGLRVRLRGKELYITNGQGFHVVIRGDQIEAIKRVARNVVEDVSSSVENILKEFSMQMV
ncbi:MAG: hypothetical protein U9Q22_07360 [Candidatus Altiarchaeota archaeon]|nr:hypothetical protein [Candidatus Altiarchaeota archaeon]